MAQRTNAASDFSQAAATATPSQEHVVAWPTLSRAAEMIGKNVSVLSRAMNSEGVPKYPAGRRDKKIAPISALHFARIYGADIDAVADALMTEAESSGAAPQFVASVEQDIGAWLAGRSRRARLDDDAPSLEVLVRAVTDFTSPELAATILGRAGIRASTEVP